MFHFSYAFDTYATIFYSLQRYFGKVVLSLHDLDNIVLYLIMFVLGVITLFTPCFVSTLPLSYLYIKSTEIYNKNLLFFVSGLLTSFILLTLIAALFGSSLLVKHLPILSYLGLTLLSLDSMRIIDCSRLIYWLLSLVNILKIQKTFVPNYFVGLFIGFSSFSCSTPIFLILNLFLLNSSNFFFRFLFIFVYVLGFLLSFIFIIRVNLFHSQFFLFRKFFSLIIPVSGSILFIFSFSSLLKVLLL